MADGSPRGRDRRDRAAAHDARVPQRSNSGGRAGTRRCFASRGPRSREATSVRTPHSRCCRARACALLYVFLAILTIGMPITTFVGGRWLVNYDIAIDGAIFAVVVGRARARSTCRRTQRATGRAWRGLALVPFVIAVHVGLSACCAVGVRRGARRGAAPSSCGRRSSATQPPRRLGVPAAARSPFAIVELAIGGRVRRRSPRSRVDRDLARSRRSSRSGRSRTCGPAAPRCDGRVNRARDPPDRARSRGARLARARGVARAEASIASRAWLSASP